MRARTASREPLAALVFVLGVLSVRSPSRRARRSSTRKPSGNQGRKGNGPEDRSWGPLFTDASRDVREEEEMAQILTALRFPDDRCNHL
jgi:hypothetical protein